jgi:beta-lactamase superfamily II metal-dependent hydrolase
MKRFGILLVLSVFLLRPAVAEPDDHLQIVVVDVEGGAAVLMKTPEGRSVLIDTGWAPGQGGPQAAGLPTSAERIAAAAAHLGVVRIDYLIMTHYHADHLGGLETLLAKLPVDTFVDHGANREPLRPDPTPQQRLNAPEARYPAWVAAWQGHRHLSVVAGDVLRVGTLNVQFVASDGAVLKTPLAGAGMINPTCANVPPPPKIGGEENVRSLGMLMTFGNARILNLGDLTWTKEIELLCPTNKIGPVDILFVTGHGMSLSSSPPTAALRPKVAIMQNGPTKGGDESVVRTVEAYPGLQAFWRLHDISSNPALNGDAAYIANRDGEPDQEYPILLDIERNGHFAVVNERTAVRREY